jgi:hypothetical protein
MGVADILARKRRVNEWIDEVGDLKEFQRALKGENAQAAFEEMSGKIFWNADQEDGAQSANDRMGKFCEIYFGQLSPADQLAVAARALAAAQKAHRK